MASRSSPPRKNHCILSVPASKATSAPTKRKIFVGAATRYDLWIFEPLWIYTAGVTYPDGTSEIYYDDDLTAVDDATMSRRLGQLRGRVWDDWYEGRPLSLRAAQEYEYEYEGPDVVRACSRTIFDLCRNRYLDDASLFDAEDEVMQRILSKADFDCETLKETFIALCYDFAKTPNALQLRLEEDEVYTAHFRLVERWRFWFYHRVVALSREELFRKAVVCAVVYPNPDVRGKQAEDALRQILRSI